MINAFEYKFVHLYNEYRHWEHIQKVLNDNGQIGWKCIKIDWDDSIACCTILFEREHHNE